MSALATSPWQTLISDQFSLTFSESYGPYDAPSRPARATQSVDFMGGAVLFSDQVGTDGPDRLIGGSGGDDLIGNGGDDILVGNDGGDDLFGGDGNDILVGGNGGDDLRGDEGRDILIGGSGSDTFILEAQGFDIIRDFQDGVDELQLTRGLSFNSLTLQQQGGNTLILASDGLVAVLVGIDISQITPSDLA